MILVKDYLISHLSCFNFDLWVFKVGLSMFWFCLVYIFVAAFSSLVTCVFLASTYACQFFSICFYFFDLGRIDGQCLCSSYFVINIVLDQFDWSVLLEKYSAWMLVHCPFWLVKGHHRDLLDYTYIAVGIVLNIFITLTFLFNSLEIHFWIYSFHVELKSILDFLAHFVFHSLLGKEP